MHEHGPPALRAYGTAGQSVHPGHDGVRQQVDESAASQLVDWVVDAGVNVVDTANVYASGRSEEIVGQQSPGAEARLSPAELVRIDQVVPPGLTGDEPDMFIAGNSDEAKQIVTSLLGEFGWPVIDMGGGQVESSALSTVSLASPGAISAGGQPYR